MSERPVTHHDPGARRVTYRQIFTRSLVALSTAFVAFALWVLFAPTTLPAGTVQREPILLVIVPVFMTLLAALAALVLTTVWWLCWGWWHPVSMPVAPPRLSRVSRR